MLPPPDRRRRILILALPIIGGMVSQNILNLVDTAGLRESLDEVGTTLNGFNFIDIFVFTESSIKVNGSDVSHAANDLSVVQNPCSFQLVERLYEWTS